MSEDSESSSWRRTLALCLRVALCGVALVSAAGFVGGDWLPLELTTHFRPHLLVVLCVGSVWLLALRRWRALLPVALLAMLNAVCVVPWFVAGRELEPTANAEPLRLLLANVLTTNRGHDLVLDQIAHEDPDIVVLQETDLLWMSALEVLEERYPQHIAAPRGDNFGIALFSRLPIADLRVLDIGAVGVPSIAGTLTIAGQPVTLIATHPVPPLNFEYFAWRNQQLRALADFAADQPRSILIGDLNMTMWSPYHTRFEENSGLRNVRRGRGVLATWPVGLGPFKIPLDHCLVSPGIGVRNLHVGQTSGGDHLPLIVELAL